MKSFCAKRRRLEVANVLNALAGEMEKLDEIANGGDSVPAEESEIKREIVSLSQTEAECDALRKVTARGFAKIMRCIEARRLKLSRALTERERKGKPEKPDPEEEATRQLVEELDAAESREEVDGILRAHGLRNVRKRKGRAK